MQLSQSSLNDFVAAVHALRSQFDEGALTEDQEITQLMGQLKKLESFITEFDDIAGVKELRSILLGQMRTSSPLNGIDSWSGSSSSSSSSSCSVNGSMRFPLQENSKIHVMRRRVFEIVRTEFIPMLKQTIQTALAHEQADGRDALLLSNAFSHVPATSKKQKGGFYSSFNFDDLPEYEPLEATLKLLRADHCSENVLSKLLLELELDDLVDHPQWKELLALIRYALYQGTTRSRTLSMQLHVRFATGLNEIQSADVVLNLLNYFTDKWVVPIPTVEKSGTDQQIPDDLTMVHISVFASLLSIIPARILQPSMETDGDRLIATVFVLLAQGRVATSSAIEPDTEDSPRIPLLDVMTRYTHQRGDFIATVMAKRRPVAVITHAVHSGLVIAVGRRVMAQPTDNNEDAVSFATSMRILLNLFLPFATRAVLVDFCATFVLMPPEDTLTDLRDYVWDGAREPYDDDRFEEPWRTELLKSVGARSVAMKADLSVNRLMSHLANAKPFVNEFLTNSHDAVGCIDGGTLAAENFSRLIVHLSANLKAFAVSVPTAKCLSSTIELLLRTVARGYALLAVAVSRQVVNDCIDCVAFYGGRRPVPGTSEDCFSWSSALADGLDAILLVAGESLTDAATRATTEIYVCIDGSTVASAGQSQLDRRKAIVQKLIILWTHVVQIRREGSNVDRDGDISAEAGALVRVLRDALSGAGEAIVVGPRKSSSAVALLVAVTLHGCSNQHYATALATTSGLVTALVSCLTTRLCVLCEEMQLTRAIVPQRSAVDAGDPVKPRPSLSQANDPTPPNSSSVAASSTGLEASVLVDAIVAAIRAWGEQALTVVLSPATRETMVRILRREETSERIWESSLALPMGDEAPLLRLLAGLCRRSSFSQQSTSFAALHQASADRVLSLCVSAWQPLRDFCVHHALLSDCLLPTPPLHGASEAGSGSRRAAMAVRSLTPHLANESEANVGAAHESITARILTTVLRTGDMGGIEFEGVGPYILRILFCCLSSDQICLELCQFTNLQAQSEMTVEVEVEVDDAADEEDDDHYNDIMGCFVQQLRGHVAFLSNPNSAPSREECRNFDELLLFLNYNI